MASRESPARCVRCRAHGETAEDRQVGVEARPVEATFTEREQPRVHCSPSRKLTSPDAAQGRVEPPRVMRRLHLLRGWSDARATTTGEVSE
jgi:hypothetical protein